MSKTLPRFQGCVREDWWKKVKKLFFSGELQTLPVTHCDNYNIIIKSVIEAFSLDILKNTMTVFGTLLSVVKQQINYLYICKGNSMICSDIWHKYHECYFKIVLHNFTSR